MLTPLLSNFHAPKPLCAVKKHLEKPPEFSIVTKTIELYSKLL